MNLPHFVHVAPATIQDACALLLRHHGEARVLAGGTDVLVRMKHRRQVPRCLVNIKRIRGLDTLHYEQGRGLRIGALTVVERIKNSALVRKKYPALHDAVSCLGTIEIRNRATLVGNICNASPAAETVPSLMLLGASARVAGTGGERTVALRELFIGPGRTALQPGELVTEIHVPEPAPESAGAYDKFSLRRMDLAVVGAAAMLALDGHTCRDIKIVISSVAPTAIRARGAEEVLCGKVVNEQLIQEAGRAAAEESRPRADLLGSVEYKKQMTAVLTSRVIAQALERAKKGSA